MKRVNLPMLIPTGQNTSSYIEEEGEEKNEHDQAVKHVEKKQKRGRKI